MIKSILLVALGGGVGSVCRYLLSGAVNKLGFGSFPMGTMAVNILGCFVIGLLFGLSLKMPQFNGQWRLLLITGLLGGFTTFSSFSYESVSLLSERQFLYFFGYLGGSVLLGLLATWVGLILTK